MPSLAARDESARRWTGSARAAGVGLPVRRPEARSRLGRLPVLCREGGEAEAEAEEGVGWRWGRWRHLCQSRRGSCRALQFLLLPDWAGLSDSSQLLWAGPVPGDIAEIEAYCRIFRAAEQLHTAIMETLCDPETGECMISYNIPSEELPALEEKIVAVLGCIVALLNRGREDVLSGRSSPGSSFSVKDISILDGRLPPLAVFRGEMKRVEVVKDEYYQSAVEHAISYGKVSVVHIPVELGTAPSMEQLTDGMLLKDTKVWPQSDGQKFVPSITSDNSHPDVKIKQSSEKDLDNTRYLNGMSSKQVPPSVDSENQNGEIAHMHDTNKDNEEPHFVYHKDIDPLNSQVKGFRTFSPSAYKQTIQANETLADIQLSPSIQERKSNGTFPSKDSYPRLNRAGDISKGYLSNENGMTFHSNANNSYDVAESTTISSKHGSVGKQVLSPVVREKTGKYADVSGDLDGSELVEGNMEKVTESSLAFTHPSTQQQMLMWKSTPKTVLLLKKIGKELMEEAKEVASFLHHQEKMNVLVEPGVHDVLARIPGFGFVQTFYSQDTSDLHERVDFVACLGGDGVILHASNLFRGAVPPVVSFSLGSLGFLTSHTFDDYGQDLRAVIHGNNTLDGVYITLRMRLRCEIFRNGKAIPGKVFDVLNEVVVDRGSNPYLSKIECYEHNLLITKVQGDGVIIATPTGSTAYSTSAGGSMVHPNVPCILFTPICPHSLSFRPVILPDSARLELKIPEDARSNAWVSFDGKRRQQLSRGDSVRICMSQHPLPTVNKSDQTGDWFHSLIRCLNWNERLDQKAL
ncbi:hypothetical protein Taro_002866 [Colocasia esculenta]|uniref:NAD(+) kinase n=1 Tax=Colocasia esculenta TaxID=4460 RepID=A0A843TFD6_COLES|nr:hypothetical protein [Colocasia esculenta]